MSKKKKLIIIGAGGHGKVVADIALKMGAWEQDVFLDDDESIKSAMGIAVIGKTNLALEQLKEADVFIAIGNNKGRELLQSKMEALGASIPVLIHPAATIGEKVEIGEGTVIMAGAVVNCCTVIGKGCIINTGATVDHDNIIEDYAHLSPGVHTGGTVKIGRCTHVGIGAAICNNVEITEESMIGAGAAVTKNILEAGTHVGIPAKKL